MRSPDLKRHTALRDLVESVLKKGKASEMEGSETRLLVIDTCTTRSISGYRSPDWVRHSCATGYGCTMAVELKSNHVEEDETRLLVVDISTIRSPGIVL